MFAEKEDLLRWIKEDRRDILEYCEGKLYILKELEKGTNPEDIVEYLMKSRGLMTANFWFNKKTGYFLWICPFLRKRYGKKQFECTIHETKPKICREYICNLSDMMGIRKRSFEENYRIYKKKRRNNRRPSLVFSFTPPIISRLQFDFIG
jgi:Fe-S-cluster containining protein